MDITTRNRRLKEFLLWFEYKYGLQSNIKTIGVQRVIDQTIFIQAAISAVKPVCYWCRKPIHNNAISVDTDDVTLHHVDEDRNHNTVDNLDICHKTCHQRMHKLSQSNGIPTAVLWCAAYGVYNPSCANIAEIPGIGRG